MLIEVRQVLNDSISLYVGNVFYLNSKQIVGDDMFPLHASTRDPSEFEKLTEKVMSGDINRDAFRRKVFGSVELVSFDAQGRILLTEDLRKKAGITDKVCMVGMYNWLELWNEDRLAEIEKELTTEEELKCMEALGLA